MSTPIDQETPEERTRRCNAAQAARQVPAGDVAALREHKKKYPWANITPPETVAPYRSPQQIELQAERDRLRGEVDALREALLAMGHCLTDQETRLCLVVGANKSIDEMPEMRARAERIKCAFDLRRAALDAVPADPVTDAPS